MSGYDKYVRNIAVPKIFITNLSVSAVGFLHEAAMSFDFAEQTDAYSTSAECERAAN